MSIHDPKQRTGQFALRVIRLCESIPKGRTSDTIARHVVRCGTLVGANYRAASRAKSKADFIAKMAIVEEECDESLYWMELLIEAGIVEERLLAELMRETDKLLAVTVSSIKTARRKAR